MSFSFSHCYHFLKGLLQSVLNVLIYFSNSQADSHMASSLGRGNNVFFFFLLIAFLLCFCPDCMETFKYYSIPCLIRSGKQPRFGSKRPIYTKSACANSKVELYLTSSGHLRFCVLGMPLHDPHRCGCTKVKHVQHLSPVSFQHDPHQLQKDVR